jgi:phosphoribosylaminoimidazolecarboxamide formyltransferase/IMP cyclohydrolase
MVRSAAKNQKDVTILTNPNQYGIFIDALKGNISVTVDDLRPQFAIEAFKHTAEYDTAINKWMSENKDL